jgi:hypothetical protein
MSLGQANTHYLYKTRHVVEVHYTSDHELVISAYMAIRHSCCIPRNWPFCSTSRPQQEQALVNNKKVSPCSSPYFLLHKNTEENEHATGVLCSSLRYVASLSTWLSKPLLALPRVHLSTTKPDPRRTRGSQGLLYQMCPSDARKTLGVQSRHPVGCTPFTHCSIVRVPEK